jgi:hypothetical protein
MVVRISSVKIEVYANSGIIAKVEKPGVSAMNLKCVAFSPITLV